MTLTEFFDRFQIEGLSYDELDKCFMGTSDKYKLLDTTPYGCLVVKKDNGEPVKTLKCVSHYYTGHNGEVLKSSSLALKCYQVQKELDCETSSYRCTNCLRRCINNHRSGLIYKK